MKNFFKKVFKYGSLFIMGYALHILVEAFVVTNILAMFGMHIPVLV